MSLQYKKSLKTLCKIVTALIFIYLVLVILEYAHQGFINDLSMQKVDLSVQNSMKEPVYLVSYADGAEHIYRNQNATSHYAINKGIDFILNYKKKHIDQTFIEKHQEIFNEKAGAGLWLWKPYIILETMKNAPEGAIIVYLDSAFIIKQHISNLTNLLGNNDVLLVHDRDRKNGSFVKGESFALMNCLNEECRNDDHIWSAVIVVRNTELARSFIEKWLKSCEDIRVLSGKDYNIHPNYDEYKWHHSDQSVLSLVYHQNPQSVKVIEYEETMPILSWFHRKNSNSSPLKAWYSIYGIDPVINFNTNGKALPSTALINTSPIVKLRKWISENFY
ncbi:hypothetical protein A3306_07130 [Rickettsia bellii]|uniref:Nucleotide-diphospho-sugar transferase domain-containing protein n=3 Tax=Rickettsia bellii TaxID=33990 RepID=Q1RJ53_RICBR|nr:hypothetical protein [Rickettsia bellii]ABE04611.1 unknown [Rickettsia bellii RML369-C]ABV78973.1 hypothetical protein A1I_03040 [Rickettsia bellii OSU 85-389]ARD86874.1 hypothetical protein A3306_07130 [Rickettsia bellii]KJV89390.1 hypothetical protein RBEAN4_0367 [Rickettsia bellii str. RML An4]KJV91652.1 hypothetical protein RBEMOGI_0259 [Rickettsia bellii str. RML Mogi]